MVKIHSFESFATLDGDGIRYAIFFIGCPLRCVYCHNPDTWCSEGKSYSTDEIFNKIKRYKPYFKDNGGVTFSGGEPLLSCDFINEINEQLKPAGIKYALDTSGSVPLTDGVKTALLNADLVILDLKFYDSESYLKYTLGNFNNVMNTLKFLQDNNIRTWIRTVIVPGINNDFKILDKYVNLIRGVSNIEKYELLGFHTMGFKKYEALNIDNPLKDTKPLEKDELNILQKYVNDKLKG